MTTEQLKAAHEATPFKPFRLHLADGTSIGVDHPELLWRTQGGRTVFVNSGGEDVTIIDLLLVTKITFGNGHSKRRRG
jgi:hypothetical protein